MFFVLKAMYKTWYLDIGHVNMERYNRHVLNVNEKNLLSLLKLLKIK